MGTRQPRQDEGTLVRDIAQRTGLDREAAERAADIAMELIAERLTTVEAWDASERMPLRRAQSLTLPREARPSRMGVAELHAHLGWQAGLDANQSRAVVRAVLDELAAHGREGSQVPDSLRDLADTAGPPRARTPPGVRRAGGSVAGASGRGEGTSGGDVEDIEDAARSRRPRPRRRR